jgi:hypothetical protein
MLYRGGAFGFAVYCLSCCRGGRGTAVSGVLQVCQMFWENSKVWIVWKGYNKAGWYLEMAVYVVGGLRGFILLPEGRGGRGG